jgi:hypothetical protein
MPFVLHVTLQIQLECLVLLFLILLSWFLLVDLPCIYIRLALEA